MSCCREIELLVCYDLVVHMRSCQISKYVGLPCRFSAVGYIGESQKGSKNDTSILEDYKCLTPVKNSIMTLNLSVLEEWISDLVSN
jgi:hypothetical protein